MFETIFKNTAKTTDLSINTGSALFGIAVALIFGLIISAVYIYVSLKNDRSPSFILALVILPALVSVIILLVGSNIARAFSIAGVFALIRFRSVPGDSKDLSFILLSMALGLAIGLGYLTFGAVITLIICLVIVLIYKSGYGMSKKKEMRMRIIIPEDMNFNGAFDDIFQKYTSQCDMNKVKTTNLGTLFELSYDIIMKDKTLEKEFIDAIRCRNGNLTVQLEVKENNYQQL